MIPKVVYQTWKTKSLPESTQRERTRMMEENPEYEFRLFDDAEMDAWIATNTDEQVQNVYSILNVGAAKADLWRYLILYKEGGIYLDIDSNVICPFREFIHANDVAIISRTFIQKIFNQWLMIFEAGHPILKTTIDIVLDNIRKRITTNISDLTGPGAFSRAIDHETREYYTPYDSIYDEYDDDLNAIFCKVDSPIQCRFIGFDFKPIANWKYEDADQLYKDVTHWTGVRSIYKE